MIKVVHLPKKKGIRCQFQEFEVPSIMYACQFTKYSNFLEGEGLKAFLSLSFPTHFQLWNCHWITFPGILKPFPLFLCGITFPTNLKPFPQLYKTFPAFLKPFLHFQNLSSIFKTFLAFLKPFLHFQKEINFAPTPYDFQHHFNRINYSKLKCLDRSVSAMLFFILLIGLSSPPLFYKQQ